MSKGCEEGIWSASYEEKELHVDKKTRHPVFSVPIKMELLLKKKKEKEAIEDIQNEEYGKKQLNLCGENNRFIW